MIGLPFIQSVAIHTEAIARAIRFPKPIVRMVVESVRVDDVSDFFTVHRLVLTPSEKRM